MRNSVWHRGKGAWHRGLIGGCIYILPDEFLVKSVVFKLISKEISRAEHEFMNIPPPPPPINALATALK